MDWGEVVRSTVAVGAISGTVALIGFRVSSATALRINRDKLELDKDLAQQRSVADLALAERKVELDRKLALAKRRAEIAEKVLADFYKVQKAFDVIRSPMIWAAEMKPEEGIEADVLKNDGYSVMRRLRENATLFSELEATRFTFKALFGAQAAEPHQLVIKLHNQVFHAAQSLLQYRNDDPHLPGLVDFLPKMRKIAFSGRLAGEADTFEDELTKLIADIEAICRPALESELAAEASGREL